MRSPSVHRPGHTGTRAQPAVYVCGGLAALAYAGLALRGRWSEHLGTFFALYVAAWIAALGASRARSGLRPILLGAALFRATLVPVEPSLSDDLYRYIWEGRVQAAGYDPYVLPPAAPELSPLRDSLWPRINHPDATAIYPPLAQIVFRGLASVAGARGGGAVMLFKAFLALADLGLVGVLVWALQRRGAPAGRLALYAWNPLAVVEVAGSGHLEPLALLLLVTALAIARERRVLGWCALAASIAVKYAGLLLVPIVWRAARPRPLALAAALGLLALVTLPYAGAGAGLVASLRLYIDTWRYNDLLFRILHALVGSLDGAKLVAAGLLGALIAGLVLRRVPLEPAALAAFVGLLALSPTVHPWYLLWPAALLPLVPWMPVFVWCGSVCFAYLFLYPAGRFGPLAAASWTPAALQLLPVLVAVAASRLRQAIKSAGPPVPRQPRADSE